MNFFEKLKSKFISKNKEENFPLNNESYDETTIPVCDVAENDIIENVSNINQDNQVYENKSSENIQKDDFSKNNIENNDVANKTDDVENTSVLNESDTNSMDDDTYCSSSSNDKNSSVSDLLPSEIIKNKLLSCGGCAKIYGLNNGEYTFSICNDGKSFSSPSLPNTVYDFIVFDIIVDLLKSKGGKAKKGVGRGKGIRLGDVGCEVDTVVGVIAKEYWKKNIGESVLDPVFIMAAILQWAEICDNKRGYIEIRQ